MIRHLETAVPCKGGAAVFVMPPATERVERGYFFTYISHNRQHFFTQKA